MSTPSSTSAIARRAVLRAASWGWLGAAGSALAVGASRAASDERPVEEDELIRRLFGREAVTSPRVHLQMPPVFGNGYSVPLSLEVDSPMTDSDHVRRLHVLAPQNPIIVAAGFQFTPESGRAAIATHIRLAQPQNVLALAEMSDGALLMARTWVKVTTNGCV